MDIAYMVPLPFTLPDLQSSLIVMGGGRPMRYDAGFRWAMGTRDVEDRTQPGRSGRWLALAVFVLLEAMLSAAHAPTPGAVLFRFQLSSMIAMGVFAGLAIVIFVRLSRTAETKEVI